MTASERIEEILYQAHELGIREEVIQYSIDLREINPKLDMHDSYEVALNLITQALEDE